MLAYQNMTGQLVNGQPGSVTEFSAYNNGGSTAAAIANTGTNIGNNRYTVNLAVPNDTATAIASGTARVVSYGQIKENKLDVQTRLEVSPVTTVNVVAQHTFKDVLISGAALNPRRAIVSNEKCNVCHGAFGATSGSNTLANAFHDGAPNTVEACVVCHDANLITSTIMTDGSSFNESYQFKRMIHGIHGNSKRASPFTFGNLEVGIFCNPAGTTQIDKDLCAANALLPLVLASDVENYAAEVAYPGVGLNCNACHVNDSYKQDLSPLGSVVKKDVGVTDPNGWKVISPKVATCTACHDSAKAIEHVTLNIGDPGAVFGTQTQADLVGFHP